MPQTCDNCGGDFSVEHALSCRFGGVVVCIHNEVQDAIGDFALLVWGNVICEPVVCEQSATDLCVRGVWIPQAEALFDNCVVDNDAKSYSDRTPMVLLSMQSIIRSRNTHRLVKTGLSKPQNYFHSPVCQLMACSYVKL